MATLIIIYILILLCSCILIFSGFGHLFALKINQKSSSPEITFCNSFIIGAAGLGLLSLILAAFNLSNQNISHILIFLWSVVTFTKIKEFIKLISQIKAPLLIWLLYASFCVFSILSPKLDIYNFKLSDLQTHLGLPIDNIIQFQTVRYLTEHINPNSIDPVPNWKFTDRGPLFGIIESSIFFILQTKEKLTWLNSSYPASILFEAIGIILNSFFIFAVFAFSKYKLNEKTAFLSILFLIFNPFIYINSVYTWPKLFAASLGLLSILHLSNPKIYLSGFFLGLGMLSHESLFFSVPAICIYIFYKHGWKNLIYFLLVSLITQAPWLIYKNVNQQASSNMFIHNVLCKDISQTNEISFLNILSSTLKEDGIQKMLSTRIGNFIYPFDFRYINWTGALSFANPLSKITLDLTDITFYQFIYAAGPILIAFFFLTLIFKHKKEDFLAFSYLAITVAAIAIFQGCELSSWNHHWAYLPILMFTIWCSKVLTESNVLISLPVTALQIYISGSILINYIWFPPRSIARLEGFSIRDRIILITFTLCFLFIINRLHTARNLNFRKEI